MAGIVLAVRWENRSFVLGPQLESRFWPTTNDLFVFAHDLHPAALLCLV